MNNWDYKIELKSKDVFQKLEQIYGVEIPAVLRAFVEEHNAAYPEKNLIIINDIERVFESVLSFNEDEEEGVSVFDIIESHNMATAVPFGMDPFGNLFYISLVDGIVLFYDHEDNSYTRSDYSLIEFVDALH